MLQRSARFSLKNPTFFGFARQNMLFGAGPQTTIFIVVSGAHTEVALADVPETTIKIVVSGTSGDKEKQAEEKKKQIKNQDMFLGAVPQTTVFIVVSGGHTGSCSCA